MLPRLDGEPLATFGATILQYQTAFGSGHARTETMGAFALQYTGLECAFHVEFRELAKKERVILEKC